MPNLDEWVSASFVISPCLCCPTWLTFLVIVSYWSSARKIRLLAGVRFSIQKDGVLFFYRLFQSHTTKWQPIIPPERLFDISLPRLLAHFHFFLLAVLFEMTCDLQFFYPPHTISITTAMVGWKLTPVAGMLTRSKLVPDTMFDSVCLDQVA